MDESVMPPGEPERWLPVVDYEGFYEVSDLGRVRSVSRVITRPGNRGRTQRVSGRVLKQQKPTERTPYRTVELWRDGNGRPVKVYVLVARAFLGPRPEGHDICHGPGGKLDDRVVNLSYGTRSKNSGEDRRRDGTLLVGSQCNRAKLTEEIVRQCRFRAACGETANRLAGEFGVHVETMRKAITGGAWQHVPAPVPLPRGPRPRKTPGESSSAGNWYGVRISVPIRPERLRKAA